MSPTLAPELPSRWARPVEPQIVGLVVVAADPETGRRARGDARFWTAEEPANLTGPLRWMLLRNGAYRWEEVLAETGLVVAIGYRCAGCGWYNQGARFHEGWCAQCQELTGGRSAVTGSGEES